jgi:hypothetical protein
MNKCGKCPISLVCYMGNIWSMGLCPQCNMLEVLINISTKKLRIQCVRTCDKSIRKTWFREYQIRVDYLKTFRTSLYTSVCIRDPGPLQKVYINSKLPIRLCSDCIAELQLLTDTRIKEELRKMNKG